MRHRVIWIGALTLAAVAVLSWRHLGALWLDDMGDLALAHGDNARAVTLFNQGLALVPDSRLLLEDRGRALLESDPEAALRDFTRAGCGAPCVAEAGDAHARLGHINTAVAEYLDAKAANRLAAAAQHMASQGKFDTAIALESALSARLASDALLSADLAASQARIGKLAEAAAFAYPDKSAQYRTHAIAAYARASSLAPLNEGYLLSLGFAQMKWGDKRAARDAFAAVLAHHPHQADAERALEQLGQPSAESGPHA